MFAGIRDRRAELLAKWRAKGGVFLIGYTAFRNLSVGKNIKDRNMAREICYALQVYGRRPGHPIWLFYLKILYSLNASCGLS